MIYSLIETFLDVLLVNVLFRTFCVLCVDFLSFLVPERTSERNLRSWQTMMSLLGEPAGDGSSHVTQGRRKASGEHGAETRKTRNATCTEYDTDGTARCATSREQDNNTT